MWDRASKAIDIWSVGCIFAELIGRKVLFPGKNYLNQLDLILDILGTPTEDKIRGCLKARKYMKTLKSNKKKDWSSIFPEATTKSLDLLDKMLKFDPKDRITVEEAIKHPYLKSLHGNYFINILI